MPATWATGSAASQGSPAGTLAPWPSSCTGGTGSPAAVPGTAGTPAAAAGGSPPAQRWDLGPRPAR
eukprot:761566-Pelagomonas_calceolata.AAC.4